MMFVASPSLFLILLAPLACLPTVNNIVWVKPCLIGMQYSRRGIVSPISGAKKVVDSIRSALGGMAGDKGYLKQGEPEFYFDAEKSQTDSKKKKKTCIGLQVSIPLPDSIYQKLSSILKKKKKERRAEPSYQRPEEEVEPANSLMVEADTDGKYIDTVTDYVRNLLEETSRVRTSHNKY